MKRSKKTIVTTLGLCAIVGVSGTLAYFTATDKATNVFEIGKLSIDLQEPHWDPNNTPKNIVPNETFPKDPLIKNTGTVPAYMFAEVAVPKDTFITAYDNGVRTEATASVHEVFQTGYNSATYAPITTGYNTNDWIMLTEYNNTSSDSYNYYLFAYKTPVDKGERTTPIFTNVKFVNAVEGYIENKTYTINVEAKAIQSGSLPESIDNQSNTATKLSKVYELYLRQNNR